MYKKKALSPIVATSLLIVVAVVSVIGFQEWFNNYSSGIFSNIEQKNQNNCQLVIEGLVKNDLYLKSNCNQIINLLKIVDNNGNQICKFTNNEKSNILGDTRLLTSFDNNIYNGTHIKDLSGYNSNFKLVNTPENISTCPIDGECFYFNSEDSDWLNLTNPINISQDYSLSFWALFHPNDDVYNMMFIYDNDADGYLSKRMDIIDHWRYSLPADFGSDIGHLIPAPDINIGEWYHFVFAFDTINSTRLNIAYYVDGEFIGTEEISHTGYDVYPIKQFGKRINTYFNGSMDELGIYNKLLDSNEVDLLYNNGKVVLYEQLITKNKIKKVNIESCNLKKNLVYNLIVNTKNQILEKEIFYR